MVGVQHLQWSNALTLTVRSIAGRALQDTKALVRLAQTLMHAIAVLVITLLPASECRRVCQDICANVLLE